MSIFLPTSARSVILLSSSLYDAPDAGFIVVEPCIPLEGGGLVQFESRSDTGSVRWLWDFGDPESGTNNNQSI